MLEVSHRNYKGARQAGGGEALFFILAINIRGKEAEKQKKITEGRERGSVTCFLPLLCPSLLYLFFTY